MKKKLAYFSVFLICFFTLNLWLLSKPDISVISGSPMRSGSQILGLWGIVLMSLTLLLSTRLRFLENIFGGLDKMLHVHQILGSMAFIFIINHPLLLAIQTLPQAKLALLYIIPSQDLSYSLGVFGLYAMILSFIFMVFIKLPYHFWKLAHKLVGVSFLLGSIHAVLISSSMSSFLPLKIWIESFIALGIGSTFYTFFLYRYLGPKYKYGIERVERVLDIVTIYLSPVSSKLLQFNPGQFVYVKFENKILGGESHPFSIASAPEDQTIKLSAKIVGDYTLKLSALSQGGGAVIFGPYGKFNMQKEHKNCLWIAGGIGVTPFLSMLASKIYRPTEGIVNFYYTYRNRYEGVFAGEIQNLIQRVSGINFFDWCSEEKKRLNVDEIKARTNLDQVDAIFLCGPQAMMESLSKQFLKIGVPENKIIFENFSFLS